MTIQELTEILSQYPSNTKVVITGYENGWSDIRDVKTKHVDGWQDIAWFFGTYQPVGEYDATEDDMLPICLNIEVLILSRCPIED